MIKVAIFDFAGVVLNIKPLLSQAQTILKIQDRSKLWEIINIESIPLCDGRISLLQFWKRVAKKTKNKIPDIILKDLWIKDYDKLTSIDKNVEKLIKALKKHYKIGLISNTIKEQTKINRKLDRFKLFDIVILSHEVGLSKDKKDIFLLATKRLNAKPEECVFIDDTKRFVKVASDLGMKAIHFKNYTQLKRNFKALKIIF